MTRSQFIATLEAMNPCQLLGMTSDEAFASLGITITAKSPAWLRRLATRLADAKSVTVGGLLWN